jgi:glycosyltransferase involved in cell wall biosynthesis
MSERERLRILLVSNLLPPQVVGGAELVAWRELQGMAARGHEVRGFTLEWPEPPPLALEEEGPLPEIVRVPVPPYPRGRERRALSREAGREFVENPPLTRVFEKLLTFFRPDVVHFHQLSGLSLRLPLRARRRGARLVATLHDVWGICSNALFLKPDGGLCNGATGLDCLRCVEAAQDVRFGPRRRLEIALRNARIRRLLSRFDRLVFPSRHHLHAYTAAGYPRARSRLLRNPAPEVDGVRSTPPGAGSEEPLRLLFLGSLGDHKGAHVLLEAIAGLSARTARVVLHGRATQTQRQGLEASLAARQLDDRVEYAGFIAPARIAETLLGFDAVVVPSLAAENCPLAIVEALALGRPVIASRVGGIPELVRHGENGLLFSPGDAEGLRSAIARLAADRHRLREMGGQGKAAVEKLGLSAHIDALEAIYADAIGGTAARVQASSLSPGTICHPSIR